MFLATITSTRAVFEPLFFIEQLKICIDEKLINAQCGSSNSVEVFLARVMMIIYNIVFKSFVSEFNGKLNANRKRKL